MEEDTRNVRFVSREFVTLLYAKSLPRSFNFLEGLPEFGNPLLVVTLGKREDHVQGPHHCDIALPLQRNIILLITPNSIRSCPKPSVSNSTLHHSAD
jgi:hypothetical protein